jgi:hypothetical protein
LIGFEPAEADEIIAVLKTVRGIGSVVEWMPDIPGLNCLSRLPLHPTWQDIAIRLLLTMIASAAIGFDNSPKCAAVPIGKSAGLRSAAFRRQ